MKNVCYIITKGISTLGAQHGDKMKVVEESYQSIKDSNRSFDVRFWQSQGDSAIFEAVSEMLNDYCLIRGIDANEFRIQRTIESFRKV